jgi:DNA-binding beta-propeller fold protein YncE
MFLLPPPPYTHSHTLTRTPCQQGVAIDPDDNFVAVSDRYNHRIQMFTATGEFVSVLGKGYGCGPGQLNRPAGVKLDRKSRVYVADSLNNRVVVFAITGLLLRVIGTEGCGVGQLRLPLGIALSTSGKHVFVADRLVWWQLVASLTHTAHTHSLSCTHTAHARSLTRFTAFSASHS